MRGLLALAIGLGALGVGFAWWNKRNQISGPYTVSVYRSSQGSADVFEVTDRSAALAQAQDAVASISASIDSGHVTVQDNQGHSIFDVQA